MNTTNKGCDTTPMKTSTAGSGSIDSHPSALGSGKSESTIEDALAAEFSPSLLRLAHTPPNPVGRRVLWLLLLLIGGLIAWSAIGQLDIVAVADGKLVPQSYVKIVQPSEAGIVKDILVREGEPVSAGQVLLRMDTSISDADAQSLTAELRRKRATLARIDAELADRSYVPNPDDPAELAQETAARHQANRNNLMAALAEENARRTKARADLASAEQVKAKLESVIPHYIEQDRAFDKLAQEGFVGNLMASDKRRERVEKQQELRTQEHLVESARATLQQSERRLAQIDSDYRRSLHAERNETQGQADRLVQDLSKQVHRQSLLQLKATQDSIVKELATHTIGAVVQPGTVVVTLVPTNDVLRAEVWVANDDIGFVREGQPVKLKFAAYPFQKFGLAEGIVEHVAADAVDSSSGGASGSTSPRSAPLVYKALIALKTMHLEMNDAHFALAAGMQTSAEIFLGRRSVLEYLLSPVRQAWHDAGRER